MKKAALMLAVFGSLFFSACDTQETAEVDSTTEAVTPGGETVEVTTDATVTTETE